METFIMRHFRRGRSWVSLAALVLLAGAVGLGALLPSAVAGPPPGHDFRGPHPGPHFPGPGPMVDVLPFGYRVVLYGDDPYYFCGGVWYRPYGPRFVVTVPPFGLVVPVLPPGCVTVWVGGVPYCLADGVYYAPYGERYIVVAPPDKDKAGDGQTDPAKLYIYPRQGQSEQQQADDRYACHNWAVGQTGFDPTHPAEGMSQQQKWQKRLDYDRAMGACLEGRGYTVK